MDLDYYISQIKDSKLKLVAQMLDEGHLKQEDADYLLESLDVIKLKTLRKMHTKFKIRATPLWKVLND